ncbi:MAG: hypothetical protein NVSMB27_37210 [Ktedonobacteraceae bacterium]
MQIFGLDFTSAPGPRKPITCAACELNGNLLQVHDSLKIVSFTAFEAFLRQAGPWLAALDFPFGLPRKLLSNLGWPMLWEGYIQHISSMDKTTFEQTLLHYRESRTPGDKQHLRATDRHAGAISPMMLHRVPVGKMFFQGAPRLLASGASILPCRPTKDSRIVVEGYPALVARALIGKRSYKSDERNKQTPDKENARRDIVAGLLLPELFAHYGIAIEISEAMINTLIQDHMGDNLDALLCAVQAAWAYTQRHNGYGIPSQCDKDEGWIVDPYMVIKA